MKCAVCDRDRTLAVDGVCSADCRRYIRRLDLGLDPSAPLPNGWYEPEYDTPCAKWPLFPGQLASYNVKRTDAIDRHAILLDEITSARTDYAAKDAIYRAKKENAKQKKETLGELQRWVSLEGVIRIAGEAVQWDKAMLKDLEKVIDEYRKLVDTDDLQKAQEMRDKAAVNLAALERELIDVDYWRQQPALFAIVSADKPVKQSK